MIEIDNNQIVWYTITTEVAKKIYYAGSPLYISIVNRETFESKVVLRDEQLYEFNVEKEVFAIQLGKADYIMMKRVIEVNNCVAHIWSSDEIECMANICTT